MAEDCYEITLELPGVAPEYIQLLVQDGAMTVQGEKRRSQPEPRRWRGEGGLLDARRS
jgi:HSP20 family molecular chaperone IbpA